MSEIDHEVGQTGTAVLEPRQQRIVSHLPQWRVLLHNDDASDMDYVVDTIRMLTPLTRQDAVLCMREAHDSGVALLLTTHREKAELLQEQFTSRRLSVTIEPE